MCQSFFVAVNTVFMLFLQAESIDEKKLIWPLGAVFILNNQRNINITKYVVYISYFYTAHLSKNR